MKMGMARDLALMRQAASNMEAIAERSEDGNVVQMARELARLTTLVADAIQTLNREVEDAEMMASRNRFGMR